MCCRGVGDIVRGYSMSASPPELGGGGEDFIAKGICVWSGEFCVANEYLPSFSFDAENGWYRKVCAVGSREVDPVGLCRFVHGYI